MTEAFLSQLSSLIKEKYYLDTIKEDVHFYMHETKNLSFLEDLSIPKNIIVNCNSDFLYLFPYIENKSLSFSFIGQLGRNIFLIDILPQSEFKTISPYHIKQYEERIKEAATKEKINENDQQLLISFFHQKIEKLQLLDFLHHQSDLKSLDYHFYETILLIGDEKTNKKFSTFITITKNVIRTYVETLGVVEKDDYKTLTTIRINENER